MDSDKAKLFVGGISRDTIEDVLKAHFSKYGAVSGSSVAKDKTTGSARGFGFVSFSDPSCADKALQDSHVILGRTVEVKKAIPKSEQHQHLQQQQSSSQHRTIRNDYFRTKKIFVGGLSANLTDEQFKNYFERFGRIIDVVVMQDSSTKRPRGFGFVTFDSEESVDKVLLTTFHELNGRFVEVKRAVPKDGTNGVNNTIRGSSKSSQPESYPSYSPGYEILPSYSPVPVYNGCGGYAYGTGVYGGGHPMLGYGRTSFGVTPISPGNPWSGPVMIGAGSFPFPYSNVCVYPAYMNDGISIAGMMVNGHNGVAGTGVNGKLDHVPVAMPPMVDEIKLQVNSSELKDSNGGASS